MEEGQFEQKTDEENYFVSMTDMMVGLVFIFIIMLMYYALQLRTQEDAAAVERTAAQVERTQLQQQEETAQRQRETAEAEATRAIAQQDEARRAAALAQTEAERAIAQQDEARQAAALAQTEAERAIAQQEEARRAAALAQTEADRAIAQQDEARRAAAVAQTEAARAVARQRQLEDLNDRLQGADATRAAILLQIERDMEAAGVDVDIDLEQGVLRLGDQVLFDTADADLTPRGQQILRQVAAAFSEVLPCYAAGVPRPDTCASEGYAVEALYIEGHTDNRPVAEGNPFRDNLALSAARATNTYRFMVEASATLGALCLARPDASCTPILGVSGYGDRRPIAPNDTPEGQALNRRIDFRIIMAAPDLSQIQGALDRTGGP